jgi:choline/glycine/proline betaine transport protein
MELLPGRLKTGCIVNLLRICGPQGSKMKVLCRSSGDLAAAASRSATAPQKQGKPHTMATSSTNPLTGDASVPADRAVRKTTSPRRTIQPIVFGISTFLIAGFLGLSLLYGADMEGVFADLQEAFSRYAGWIYILTVNACVAFSAWVGFSRFGKVRLGGPDAKPEFSLRGWMSMLFSAGMGIGLVFWGVAEPMYHFAEPPFGIEGGSTEAASLAITVTLFHWGLHAWAIYAVVGLSLAYAAFNHKLPLTIRSAFYSVLGERIHGPIGHTIDIVAVLATLFGLATSLGLGAQQVNSGLHRLFGIETSAGVQIALIAIITAIAIASVIAGLDKGIRRLSEFNMVAASVLLVFVFLFGPTAFLLDGLVQNIGSYVGHLAQLSTWTETYRQTDWQHSWTLFYWAWWIAWSPFVGMFIARISYGRTLRQFTLGVLLVPTVMTMVWLSIFGGAALYEELLGGGGIAGAVQQDVSTALYVLLDRYPLTTLMQMVAVVVIVTFFVTSSDSGSLVIDTITSGGHPHPPVAQKVFWATAEGVVAGTLLLTGGLTALQAGSILTGLPFAFVLLFMMYSLYRSLTSEWEVQLSPRTR